MPYNIITSLGGLFGFLRRYGGILDEIIVLLGGFTTTDPGVGGNFNVLFDWRNVRGKAYKTVPFTVQLLQPLTVNSTKQLIKKSKINIVLDSKVKRKYILDILLDASTKGFSNLVVNKECLNKKKVQKLQIITGLLTDFVNSLSLNMELITRESYPTNVTAWLSRKIETKLRVFLPTLTKQSLVLEQPLYNVGDVGTISEIERLDILETVEIIDAIRH